MSGNLKASNPQSAPNFSQSAIAAAVASILFGVMSSPAIAASNPVENSSYLFENLKDDQQLEALRLKQQVEAGRADPAQLDEFLKQALENNNGRGASQQDPAPTPQISHHELWQQAKEAQQQSRQVLTSQQIEREIALNKSMQQPTNNRNGFNAPVATLDNNTAPIGFDRSLDAAALPAPTNLQTLGLTDNRDTEAVSGAINETVTADLQNETPNPAENLTPSELNAQISAGKLPQSANSDDPLDPSDYLPDYQVDDKTIAVSDSIEQATKPKPRARKKVSLVKRLYNRFFNDGYVALPHVETTVNVQSKDDLSKIKNGQPLKNIKAALDDTTIQSVADFTAALPRLRQTALDAARAVGYYDVKLRLTQPNPDTINVIIEQLGEPVKVEENPVYEVRGEGATQPEFVKLQQELLPKAGETFNHGVYKNSKAALESLSSTYGYFDHRWLNKSVDIILPDNVADVLVIYDTGKRYAFDDVVFYTYDRENRELTADPDKLPVEISLLRKLYDFREDDPYFRPSVTKLSNDLSATRYFNTVNVETILPPDERSKASTLAFDNSSTPDDTDANGINGSANDSLLAAKITDSDDQLSQMTTTADSSASSVNGDDEDIAPINFEIDEATHEKLLAIKQKANRLSNLPNDRVLDEKQRSSDSLLGKISDSISKVAKKILPDDEPLSLDDSFVPPKLANKKTPEEVFLDKKVPLYVFVSANKPRDAQVGIGYGTDTGVRATAKIDYNLINKKGYQAGAEAALSRINKSATVYGSRPLSHPLNDKLEAKLTYEEELIDQGEGSFDLSTKTLKAALARNMHKDSGWDRSYFVRYRLDELETGVDDTELKDLPIRFTSSKPRQQALLFGYGMSKTTADSATNPTRGYRQYYGVEAGSKSVASDTDLAILHAGLSGIYTFGADKKHQVLGRLESGYIWADDFYDVPYKLRFFAGGDQSIRGYDYNSLSPIDKGYLTGGQILAVGSAEYNYEFKPGFRGAVFTDVGNAYDKNFDAETKIGVGVGIRWASPIGVVRADVAAGVSEDDIPIRLHFFIGSPL